jgi:ribosomal protein S8
MKSLLSFIVLVNQAVSLRKTTCTVPLSRSVRDVSLFLKNQGYFSAVVVQADRLFITFRYVNNLAPFYKLVVVSKSSRAVYVRNNDSTPGVFVVASSELSLGLKSLGSGVSGRVLLQIL